MVWADKDPLLSDALPIDIARWSSSYQRAMRGLLEILELVLHQCSGSPLVIVEGDHSNDGILKPSLIIIRHSSTHYWPNNTQHKPSNSSHVLGFFHLTSHNCLLLALFNSFHRTFPSFLQLRSSTLARGERIRSEILATVREKGQHLRGWASSGAPRRKNGEAKANQLAACDHEVGEVMVAGGYGGYNMI